MPPRSRLSREEKGKGIADSPSPIRDASATDRPLDDFDLIHRDALRDTESMTLSQRLLVADAHRMIRDEGADRVEVGSSDVSGSGSEASSQTSRHLRRAHRGIPFDQIDCRPTIYHPGGIFEELSPLPPELLRDTRAQSWENKLLDEARKMDGVPDLSALLKGKLQLLSKKSTPANVQASTSSDGDRASKEGAPDLVDEGVGAEPPDSSPKKKKKKSRKSKRRATEELPLEEIASLDETSEGLEARKGKGGRKRPYEGATSSVDHGEAPAVEREGAAEDPVETNPSEGVPEDRPRKKKKKRSIEAEPRPSDVEAALVEVVTRDGVSPETPPEKRKVSTRGSDPVASE
ncbi:hypothetical protein HID58_065645, partial [Brassica napus]